MSMQTLGPGAAARALGISIDTLRRWERAGRIRVERDAANHRRVPLSEVERLRAAAAPARRASARNRLAGVVRAVRVDGLLAEVEIDLTGPATVVALITRTSAEDLELAPGTPATAVVKATSVMVER